MVFARKVILNYKLPNEKTFRTVDRPIHGVAVIVNVEEQTMRGTKRNLQNSNNESRDKLETANNPCSYVTFRKAFNPEAARVHSYVTATRCVQHE